MKQFELITKVTENHRTFLIIKDENGYWGIEDKYFRNGKLTKEFNGITGHLSKTAEETIDTVKKLIEIERLIETGMDRMEAVLTVFGFNPPVKAS